MVVIGAGAGSAEKVPKTVCTFSESSWSVAMTKPQPITLVIGQMAYINVIPGQRQGGLMWEYRVGYGVSDSTNRRHQCKITRFVSACRWPPSP